MRKKKRARLMRDFADGCCSPAIQRALELYADMILTGDEQPLIDFDTEVSQGENHAMAKELRDKIPLFRSMVMQSIISALASAFEGGTDGPNLLEIDERLYSEEKIRRGG